MASDRHDQNVEDEYPRTIDYDPSPELFDPVEMVRRMWEKVISHRSTAT